MFVITSWQNKYDNRYSFLVRERAAHSVYRMPVLSICYFGCFPFCFRGFDCGSDWTSSCHAIAFTLLNMTGTHSSLLNRIHVQLNGFRILRLTRIPLSFQQIFLPYGTIVEATINRCCGGGTYLNIIVQASQDDWNSKTRGLCGTANNNPTDDFVHNNGTTPFANQNDFIEYWRYMNN